MRRPDAEKQSTAMKRRYGNGDARQSQHGHERRPILHVPDVHASISIFGAILCNPIPIIHYLQFPSRRESPGDDFRGSFQIQSLQVLDCEERAAPDAADDETPTAGTELPLQIDRQ